MLTKQALDSLIVAVIESRAEIDAGDAESVAHYALSERAFARVAVHRLLAMTPDEISVEMKNPCYHRAVVAMALLDAYDANAVRWSPHLALAVTSAAVRIAYSLPIPIAALACRSLKEKANALRVIGRFGSASDTLDQAMVEAEKTHTPEIQIAILEYAKAAVFSDNLRPYDALRLLASARSKFEAFGESRYVKAIRKWEANVLYSLSRFLEASDLYRAALSDAITENNEEEIACEMGNVAHCCAMAGETVAARGYFSVAAEMYEGLGLVIPRARMLRSLGRLAIRERGAEAVAEIRMALECFDDLGMVGESILTRLALVEELLAYDPSADVAMMCREVFDCAMTAGMDTTAATALGLLNDLARQGLATPEFVREVSGCVDSKSISEAVAVN